MKAIIALITAWIGAPAHAADTPPAAPTYAGAPAPGRAAALAREARTDTVAEAAAASITNLASLDRADAEAPRQKHGISLAAAAPVTAGASKPSGPAKPAAIYGHNVDDVVIGNARKKPPNGGRPVPAPRAAVYNGTITSEPTQALHKADGPAEASAGRRAAPTPDQATTPPKR